MRRSKAQVNLAGLPLGHLCQQLRVAKDFSVCRRGNVAIIFSLSLLPMIGMVGIAIDIARTLSARTTLQAAADAAALSAATEAETEIQAGQSSAVAQYAGKLAATQLFAANVTKVSRWLGYTPTPTVQVTPGTAVITASVSFSTPVPTVFGRVFGVNTFNTAGTASSSLTLPVFINISVVTDISQSMGLAATSAGQSQLASITQGCQFGCHAYQSGQVGTLPYEQQAHNAGIQLRIDVIRSATQNMITTAQQTQSSSNPFISFGLYTLQGGNNTSDQYGQQANGQPFTTLATPSYNYSSLYSLAGNLDLGNNDSAGIGDTDYNDAMASLTSTVPASGSGATKNSPQQFVFLLTDGVYDVWASSQGNCPANTQGWNGSHCTQPFNYASCAALKQKNVTVGVIYTTYLPIPGVASYETLVQPFANSIAGNLQQCATSASWFYQASDDTGIQNAINALFAQATGHGVLTQ